MNRFLRDQVFLAGVAVGVAATLIAALLLD